MDPTATKVLEFFFSLSLFFFFLMKLRTAVVVRSHLAISVQTCLSDDYVLHLFKIKIALSF